LDPRPCLGSGPESERKAAGRRADVVPRPAKPARQTWERSFDRPRSLVTAAVVPRFPPGVASAVRHFNAGRFFEAHEAFEELLDQVEEDSRWELAVALVQVAVAYHKASAGHAGVERMLGLAAAKLASFGDVVAGIDVDALRRRVREDVEILARDGTLRARLESAPPRIVMRRA